MKMNIRLLLFLLVIVIATAHAQEAINEGQVLLSGYVDNSGKVLLTGYATPESLLYMPFLNGTQYTFDNNTNQLYAVTDALTSKNADTWSLNFSLDGYYSDYSATFYLPAGSEVTRFEIQPELNYQFQVKEDSLILAIQGYKVESPWIKVDYKLPTVEQVKPSGLITFVLPSIAIALIAGVIFALYRRRIKRSTVVPEEKELRNKEMQINETKEIRITGEMQKVIDTLSDKEKAIIGMLIRNGGSATQAAIRYETRIPKSSLTGIIHALKRKNIIKKHENGRTNVIELSEWFISEKELK